MWRNVVGSGKELEMRRHRMRGFMDLAEKGLRHLGGVCWFINFDGGASNRDLVGCKVEDRSSHLELVLWDAPQQDLVSVNLCYLPLFQLSLTIYGQRLMANLKNHGVADEWAAAVRKRLSTGYTLGVQCPVRIVGKWQLLFSSMLCESYRRKTRGHAVYSDFGGLMVVSCELRCVGINYVHVAF